jgi:phage I-like protein
MIRDQEYRYLSPVAIVRKEDMRMVALDSAALTNRPAIPRMEPLEAHCWWLRKGKKRKEKHSMDAETTTGTSDPTVALARIAEILEIEDTADIGGLTQAILEAVRKLKGGGEKKEGEGGEPVASKRVLELLGLKADADENATFVAVNALRANGEKMTALLQRVEAAERKIADRDAEDLIRPFIQDGRINPNNVEWVASCREMARTNPEQFKLVMANTVPNPPPGKTTAPPRGAPAGRETVIANARREYDEGGTHGRLTDCDIFVDQALREQRLAPLSDEERRNLMVA